MTNRVLPLIGYVWGHPGNEHRRVRSIGRLLLWQTWQRTVRRPLTIRLVGGLCLRCYPHSNAAVLVLYCRLPEWEHMNFVRDFLRPGDLFVDVGANVGTYSLLAAATPDLQVIAIEPSTIAYRRLVENIDINALGGRVSVLQAALGAEAGEALISVGHDAINHVLGLSETEEHEVVPMERLDDLVARSGRDVTLVKVDVEGLEKQVLQGASQLLASTSPVLIVEANDPEALRDLLAPLGYQPCSYDPARRHLATVDWLDIHDNNLLAVRDRAAVEARLSSEVRVAP